LTDIDVAPLAHSFVEIPEGGMPLLELGSNEEYYSININFYVNDSSVAVFIKVLYCDNTVVYRGAVPSSSLSTGWNILTVTLPRPKEGEIHGVRIVGVAGHRDDDGVPPWDGVNDESFGAYAEDWDVLLGDGYFVSKAAEDLGWYEYEVAYQFTLKVRGLEEHNPFIGSLSLTPSKTTLSPSETFTVTAQYYRYSYCPSDYFKILYRNEATGEITEAGRWAAGYWQMVPYGWQTFTLTLIAPSTAGTYTVKAVGCSGHGTWSYFGVDWNDPRYDGGFAGHRPEEMSWNFYEITDQFSITITTVLPLVRPDLAVINVKPVQVIWDCDINDDGKIDLVAGKSTAVIVTLEISGPIDEQQIVDVEMTFNGAKSTQSYTVGQLRQRENRVEFYFTPITTGDYTITARVDPENKILESDETNNENSIEITVKDTKGLYITYFPVYASRFLPFGCDPPLGYGPLDMGRYSETVEKSGNFIGATYPISEGEFVNRKIDTPYLGNPPILPYFPFIGMIQDAIELWALGELATLLSTDRVVGIVPDDYFRYHFEEGAVGVTFPGIKAVLVEVDYWTATAHEIGHSYGLNLPRWRWWPPGWESTEEYDVNPPGNSASGFYVKGNKYINDAFCFMGVGVSRLEIGQGTTFLFRNNVYSYADGIWICDETYKSLFEKFRVSQEDPEVLLVSGIMFKDGTVELGTLYRLAEGEVDYIPEGNYSIRFLDADEQTIGEINFDAHFTCLSIL
jgi:hypothetical protein